MEFGIALFVISILVIAIYVLIELKRLRHKMFAIFLIVLILFTYISFSVVLRGQDVDYKTIPGVVEASKLYFSWLGSIFGNFRSMTTHAIKMDWTGNETSG